MNIKRIMAIFLARNCEFFRDKAAFGWNFAFPFLIIIGFGLIFEGRHYQKFKVGIFPLESKQVELQGSKIPESFTREPRVTFIPLENHAMGEQLLRQHRIDLLINTNSATHEYWINDSSPTGYLVEKLYLASFLESPQEVAHKKVIQGEEIRYIDWFFPGLLGMNMMFSALWGVGYVVVRYRKNGALKRLKATPLTPFEYLSAQMLSRIFLLMFTLVIVWFGSDLIFDFHVQGSLLLIFFLFFLGGMGLTSLGLVLAARGTSEEFTSGVLNFISWPMMFLSEVWFSLEGSPAWVKYVSQLFPLTHMLTAIRRVMNEGAQFHEIRTECVFLLLFTMVALSVGALMFSWNE